MNVISLFGYTPFYAVLAMLLAFTVNLRAGASLLVLLALTNVITDAAKVVASYPRPDAVDQRVAPLGPAWQAANPHSTVKAMRYVPARAQELASEIVALPSAVDADEAYGFPSGHVSVAMAFLCGLVFFFGWRHAWTAALVWVPLMSISRMYLGRHFLGDVIGGVAAGVVATAVAVRALNLQRLRAAADRRVLVKTVATTAACAALAIVASIPPVYEAGRLAGAVVALVLVICTAPIGYDEAPPMVRIGRLVGALACAGAVWWATSTALQATAGEPSATQAFLIGGLRMAVLMPVPVMVEGALARLRRR
jgi:membrane-associated phospholipid phosphatase